MSSEPIRIAHINLARGYRGGERQTELLIEGLAGHGWAQTLVARRDEALAGRCRSIDGLTTRQVAGNVIAGAFALGGADLVHVHEGRATQAAWLNSLLRSTPYLLTRRVQKGPRHTAANRRMYGRAAAIVPVSAAIGASIDSLDAALEWSVIPDASSALTSQPARVVELREQFGDGFVVGHVGALDDSHKGQQQIISIARRICDTEPRVRFILVGSGRDEHSLKEAAAGLDNIVFTGYVEDVGNYLAACDAFIYPSRHEGLGSILLDALEFGLPVVATTVGGIPEIIEDEANGFLCAPDDIDALTRAVLRLERDNELCERIRSVNKLKAENFSPARMTSRYIEIYTQLVGGVAA
ncbi:MAG: glycosyltransferase family 4 protein [Gammaproteobacteria bacterium]